jgi:Aspartate racemase
MAGVKTVGVIGGMGPQATMDFEARFHREAQRLIAPRFNAGYPPLVVVYLRHLPMRCDESGRPIQPYEVDPRLLDAARALGALVDFLVMTSNAPHLFAAEVERAAGRKVLSMIELVVDDVRRRGWHRVGVMGFGDPLVYTRSLTALGIECETLPPELRASLDRKIGAVMEGREGEEHRTVASQALETLRGRSVEGVILGCTEIPLLLGEAGVAADLLNPLQLLAAAAVRAALDEDPI